MSEPKMSAIQTARLLKKKDFESKNPNRRVGLVVFKDGREFWIASPTRAQWHSFKDAIRDPKRTKAAMENLATLCALDPSPEVVSSMIESGQPALAETLADKVGLLAGLDDQAELVDFPDA